MFLSLTAFGSTVPETEVCRRVTIVWNHYLSPLSVCSLRYFAWNVQTMLLIAWNFQGSWLHRWAFVGTVSFNGRVEETKEGRGRGGVSKSPELSNRTKTLSPSCLLWILVPFSQTQSLSWLKPEGSVTVSLVFFTASLLGPGHALKTPAVTVLPGRPWQPVAKACQSLVRADIH